VLFEGRDAGGKGGALKRLVEPLDPRHYRGRRSPRPPATRSATTSSGASTASCPAWAAWPFDRSWYGRVLVERIEGHATIEQWSRAYDEIVEFERTLVLEG
jgi:polyphosphate kinase 2 (PPK2 family)